MFEFSARTKKICTLIGAFVDPFIFLKVLKLGKYTYRAVTHNEKAFGKTLKKARKRLNITKKDVKKAGQENKELLSQYQKSGDIENGVIRVHYIERSGRFVHEWMEGVDGKYVLTESGSKVPRNQIVTVEYNKKAAKGVEEHQKLRNFLQNDENLSLEGLEVKLIINSENPFIQIPTSLT